MKKQFLNLGKALNKAEQKLINGGNVAPIWCSDDNFVCRTGRCDFYGHCF